MKRLSLVLAALALAVAPLTLQSANALPLDGHKKCCKMCHCPKGKCDKCCAEGKKCCGKDKCCAKGKACTKDCCKAGAGCCKKH